MRLSRIQFSVRRLMVAVAGLAILLSFAVGEIEKWRLKAYERQEYTRFHHLYFMLQNRAPQGIDRIAWDDALNLIYQTSYSSGLLGSRPGIRELGRLCDDLEEELKGEVGPETLRWLWGRFARTGKEGRWYTKYENKRFEGAIKMLSTDKADPPRSHISPIDGG